MSDTPNAVYMRQYNARKRAAGLCSRCSKPNDRPGLTYCTGCRAKLKRTTRNANLRNYGLSLEEFEALLEAQGGKCALCGRAIDGSRGPACVDHDHSTNSVRGVLDRMCNQGLGMLGDDLAGVEAALVYLKTRV